MRHSSVFIFFCLLLCASAFPQDSGIIICEADMKQVPAWTAPGSANLVEQLSCGQAVSIMALEKEYFRIQMGNRSAYVYAKYVRLQQTQGQRITQLEEEVKALKEQSTAAQEKAQPKMRVEPQLEQSQLSYEAEQPRNFDVAGMFMWAGCFHFAETMNFFGWNIAFAGNLTRHFGLEANISGHYWDSPVSIVGMNYHFVMGGPRFSFPTKSVTPFVHFLVGLAHGSVSENIFGLGISDNALALMPGLGVDVNLNRRFAIRAFQVDYPVLHSESAWIYKNLRIGGGLIVRF